MLLTSTGGTLVADDTAASNEVDEPDDRRVFERTGDAPDSASSDS